MDKTHLDSTFAKLRADADARQEARTAFMLDRLKQGRHPDTDPTFWRGYHEQPAMSLPATYSPSYNHRHWPPARTIALRGLFGGAMVAVVGVVGCLFIRARWRRVAKPAAAVSDL